MLKNLSDGVAASAEAPNFDLLEATCRERARRSKIAWLSLTLARNLNSN